MTNATNPLTTMHDWLRLSETIPHAFNRRYLIALAYHCFVEDFDLFGPKVMPLAKLFLAHRFLNTGDLGTLDYDTFSGQCNLGAFEAELNDRLPSSLRSPFAHSGLESLPTEPRLEHSLHFLKDYMSRLGFEDGKPAANASHVERHGYIQSCFFGGWDDEPLALIYWNLISQFKDYPDLDDAVFAKSLDHLNDLLPILKEQHELSHQLLLASLPSHATSTGRHKLI